MIKRTGLAGFVGNNLHLIKGFFKPFFSVTSVSISSVTPERRIVLVEKDNRIFNIEKDDRIFNIKG